MEVRFLAMQTMSLEYSCLQSKTKVQNRKFWIVRFETQRWRDKQKLQLVCNVSAVKQQAKRCWLELLHHFNFDN